MTIFENHDGKKCYLCPISYFEKLKLYILMNYLLRILVLFKDIKIKIWAIELLIVRKL
jgi:hypothetical protein